MEPVCPNFECEIYRKYRKPMIGRFSQEMVDIGLPYRAGCPNGTRELKGDEAITIMIPTATDFERELQRQIESARAKGLKWLDVNSGELHRNVGGIAPRCFSLVVP